MAGSSQSYCQVFSWTKEFFIVIFSILSNELKNPMGYLEANSPLTKESYHNVL